MLETNLLPLPKKVPDHFDLINKKELQNLGKSSLLWPYLLPIILVAFSKEQLENALRKKRECNGRALKIIEELIEPQIDRGSFVEKVIKIIFNVTVIFEHRKITAFWKTKSDLSI